MSDPQELGRLQRWMMSVITHPLGVEAGIRSEDAQTEIETTVDDVEAVVCRSEALTSVERLDVYNNGYYARLLDCMQTFFPCLVHALGEDLFNQFTMDYLQAHPPHSYTLNRLADHFVEHLEATRPAEDASAEDMMSQWSAFLVEVARFELAIDSVFDGPGFEQGETLNPDDLQQLDLDSWSQARLIVADCFRLLQFDFPINDFYSAFRRGDEPAPPDPESSYAALCRINYVVNRFPLSRQQFSLLSKLQHGLSIGESIAELAAEDEDLDSLAESLQRWFFDWAESGFFKRLIVRS